MADIEIPHSETPIVTDKQLSTQLMFSWMQAITELHNRGFTGTIVTAQLTGGGAQGSMTFENGVLVASVPAT